MVTMGWFNQLATVIKNKNIPYFFGDRADYKDSVIDYIKNFE